MSNQSASRAVLSAVADHLGVSIRDLNPALYDVVDPDALDSIFRGASGTITFEYQGLTVTVDHHQNVEVEPATRTDVEPLVSN